MRAVVAEGGLVVRVAVAPVQREDAVPRAEPQVLQVPAVVVEQAGVAPRAAAVPAVLAAGAAAPSRRKLVSMRSSSRSVRAHRSGVSSFAAIHCSDREISLAPKEPDRTFAHYPG